MRLQKLKRVNRPIRVVIFSIILIYSKIKYRDELVLKEKLKNTNSYDKEGFFFFYLERTYYYRLSRMGSSIGYATEFKDRPLFPHGITGIFIGSESTIGKNCTIMQQVTIGSSFLKDSKRRGAPTIGDNVFIGSGAMIIGKVTIGDNCRIGANAVVAKDIPANTIVVPEMKYIYKDEELDNYYYFEKDGRTFRYEHGLPVLIN